MTFFLRVATAASLAGCLTAGCNTAVPGGGLVNPPSPRVSEEKPAERNDLPNPPLPNEGERLGRIENRTSSNTGTADRGKGSNAKLPKGRNADEIVRGTPPQN
jgi:hypothetical protein